MFLRLKLIFINLASSLLLVFFLCLGSQNLEERYKLNILTNETVQLPTGFLVGFSFTLGVLGGGLTATLITTDNIKD